jgi:hypothetical protein
MVASTVTMLRTALVQTYHRYTQFTHVHPLGIMMIAAQAREAGHADLHILDMKVEDWDPERCVEELERLRPDVIGLSAMTYEAGCLHAVAKLVRERLPQARIVAGGPHPSVAADDVLADGNVEFVVRGKASLRSRVARRPAGRTEWSGQGLWRGGGSCTSPTGRAAGPRRAAVPGPT